MTRRIVAAAVEDYGLIFSVPRPGRHHDVFRRMVEAGVHPTICGNQGFLTSDGLFVDRFKGCKIAEAAGQIVRKTNPENQLFSEDLW